MLEVLIQELRQLKKRFNNPRRTRLVEGGDDLVAERAANQRPNAEVQRQQALSALPSDGRILIQQDSQVKVMSPQILGRLHLNEACKLGDGPSPARLILPIEPAPRLLAVTNNGRVALVRWEFAGQQPGSLERFLPGGLEKETLINIFPLPVDQNLSLGLLSSDGRFKRLPLEEVMELSGRAATIVKLKDGVVLKSAFICKANDDVLSLIHI